MKLRIELSSIISQFKPGDTVTGRIIITPKKSVKIKKLILLCDAAEKCAWVEGDGSDQTYYDLTRQFMDQSTYLVDEPEGLEIREETSYSFSVTIPNYAPPTFSLSNGLHDGVLQVFYSLTARLIKKGFNKSDNHVLNVTAPLPVIDGYSSGLRTNEGYEQTKKCNSLGRLFGAKPPFEAHVDWKDTNVDHKDYCAPISIDCVNRMKSPVICDIHFEWKIMRRGFYGSSNIIKSTLSSNTGEVITDPPRYKMKNFDLREYSIDCNKDSFVLKRTESIEIPAKTTKNAVFEFKSSGLSSVLATDYDASSWEEVYKQPFFKPISFKTVPNVHISVRKAKKSITATFGNLHFRCPMNLLSVPGAPCELFPGYQTTKDTRIPISQSSTTRKKPSGPLFSEIDAPPPSYSTTTSTSTSNYPQFP